MTVEGATDAEVFETFLERVLLRRLKPGDTVLDPWAGTGWTAHLRNALATAHHTRLVVCEGGLDNVSGVIHVRKVLNEILANHTGKTVEQIAAIAKIRGKVDAGDIRDRYPFWDALVEGTGAAMAIVNPIPGQETRNSDYLLKAGIQDGAIATEGLGKSTPVADNANSARVSRDAARCRSRSRWTLAALCGNAGAPRGIRIRRGVAPDSKWS